MARLLCRIGCYLDRTVYGTILVDLEQRRVVDLLPDRNAETLVAWLREHPGTEIVSLMPRLFAPLMVLLHSLSGEETGIYFGDSSKRAVCHNCRIHRHRVFDGLAARGKTSMGWFFGLKLHFVINHQGEIMAVKITPGNTADSVVLEEITRHLRGKLYADKGYISREVFHTLWQRGLHLLTGIRRNMGSAYQIGNFVP